MSYALECCIVSNINRLNRKYTENIFLNFASIVCIEINIQNLKVKEYLTYLFR